MGEGVVTVAPHVIVSSGLGSCVAVILYDTQKRIGGLAHITLPYAGRRRTLYQYADTAIDALLKEMLNMGATRQNIVAKMVGGARMFASYEENSKGIGEQNILSIKDILKGEKIPLTGKDIGGHHGRSLEFHLNSGRVIVKAIEKEDREI